MVLIPPQSRQPSNKGELSIAYNNFIKLLGALCVTSVSSVVSICMTYPHLLSFMLTANCAATKGLLFS